MKASFRFSRQQLIVFLICVAIFALGQFHRASGSVFTPILMERFALSAATVGGLVSAMFFATLVAQMPFGVALDRVGPRLVIGLCMLVVAAGTAVFALAASYDGMLLSRVLIGVGLASMGAASHVIIARNFPAADFGYVSGLVVTIGGIGGVLGTFPLAFALERLPWPAVFGAMALAPLVLSALVFTHIAGGATPRPAEAEGRPQGLASLLALAEFRRILILGAVTFAPITAITGLWGGPYLQDVAGLTPEQAGAVLLVCFLATISGGYVFGLLDRRLPARRGLILSGVALSVSCLTALALLPAPGAAVSVALLLGMIFCQHFYIPLAAHMRQLVPDHMLGRASTLMMMMSVGAIPLVQLGFGAVLDWAAAAGWPVAARYQLAFGGLAGLIAICGVIYAAGRPRAAEG